MANVTVLLFFALPIAAMLAFAFVSKARKRKAMTASTCGHTAHPGGTLDHSAWFIGPVLSKHQGGNKSPGMPAHPALTSEGFAFDIPVGIDLPLGTGPKVDYLTFRHGPLTGKTQIRMRYRLERSDPGVEVYAVPEQQQHARAPAQITLYFQREGDDWTTRGEFEAYRWYSPQGHLAEGEHEVVVPLDSGWGATQMSTCLSNPAAFRAAIDNACCAGLVFGGNEVGYGHGMRATGPARFTITAFEVL